MLALHADQIDRYGGSLGVRSAESLESALATPAATLGGRYLHGRLYEMAGRLPVPPRSEPSFPDGNKHAGLVVMLAFAGLNGFRIEADETGWSTWWSASRTDARARQRSRSS